MFERDLIKWEDEFARHNRERPAVWNVSEGLSAKITPDGRMNAFFGATTVIPLGERDREKYRLLQEELFAAIPGMLVPIELSTFHVTVHALANVYSAGPDPADVRRNIAAYEDVVREAFAAIGADYAGEVVRLRTLGVSTNSRDVVSVKLVPSAERDYRVLTDLFDRLETVYPLRKPYVPHVSLGYFQLRVYGPDEIGRLYDTLERLNGRPQPNIELSVDDLAYQYHEHMNDFRNVFTVGSLLAKRSEE